MQKLCKHTHVLYNSIVMLPCPAMLLLQLDSVMLPYMHANTHSCFWMLLTYYWILTVNAACCTPYLVLSLEYCCTQSVHPTVSTSQLAVAGPSLITLALCLVRIAARYQHYTTWFPLTCSPVWVSISEPDCV